MFSLFITLVFAIASVHAGSRPCWSFWSGLQAGDQYTVNDQCYTSTDFPPETVNKASVTIAYVQGLQGNPNLHQWTSQIHQAILESLNVYSDLQASFTGVVVIMTNADDPDYPNARADTFRPGGNGLCQTRIYNNWMNLLTPAQQLQAIAHEMYHCVQQSWAGNPGKASDWWVEGTAHYFSNVVYPPTNLEWKDIVDYQAYTPIYVEPNPYSCDVFFQSLEKSKGAFGIHQWVKARTSTSTPDDERNEISSADDFPDDFHLFAKLYTFQNIYDTDGQLVPSPQPPDPIEETLTTDGDDATTGQVTLSLDTFTIGVFLLQVDPGQTVTISYTSQLPNARLSYRLPTDTVWTTMPSGGVSAPVTADGTVVLPCNNGDPLSILILFTSTDDADTASAVVTVTQTFPDNTCSCNTPQRRGVQACTPGFVPSASAISGSISAAPTQSISVSSSTESSSTMSSSTASSSTESSSTASSSTASSSDSASITPTPTSSSPTSSAPTSSAPTSGATGSCTQVASLKPDPCLIGPTWTLDLNDIEALMKKQLATLTAETINSLSLSGAGTLVIEGTNATFSYKDLTIDLDISAEGLDVPTTTVINGDFEANLYVQDASHFCLDVYSGEGSADISTPITGELTYDLGPDGGFVPEFLSITYTCAPGQLTIQGYLNGDSAWGPYVYTS